MKLRVALALLSLSACQPASAPGTPTAAPICLRSYAIYRTDVPDDSTILFTMLDRTVYKNTLIAPCTGLRLDPRGFTYEATDPATDEICSNLVTIHTNTLHTTCELGAFVRLPGKGQF